MKYNTSSSDDSSLVSKVLKHMSGWMIYTMNILYYAGNTEGDQRVYNLCQNEQTKAKQAFDYLYYYQ